MHKWILFGSMIGLGLSQLASAVVPEISTLASRAAEQHGRGVYQIEQEVTFRAGADTHTIKETWVTNGEGEQRVTLEGRGPLKGLVSGSAIYTNNLRYFVESGASVRTQRMGDDWLEPLFLFRYSRWFKSRLVGLHVGTAEILKERPPLATEGDLKYEPSPFVRLARTGGTVSWAIGAVPGSADKGVPTLWMEQDQFVIRKFRGADQATIKADDYAKFEDGLWFPRNRTYSLGNAVNVTAQVVTIRSLGKAAAQAARFKTSTLSAREAWRPPDVEGLREFYARFR